MNGPAAGRRGTVLGLAILLLLPSGCASARGMGGIWMAGMMGVVVVGGAVFGGGMMHGRRVAPDSAAFIQRFDPAHLLDERQLLELSEDQVSALEALREDVASERRTAAEAAHAAYELLRPVQRSAVGNTPPPARQHH